MRLLKLIILLLMLLLWLLLLLMLLLWPCLLLLITLYVINESCSEAHGAHVEFVWWGVVGWGGSGGVCTIIFVSYSVEVVLRCVVVGVVTIVDD